MGKSTSQLQICQPSNVAIPWAGALFIYPVLPIFSLAFGHSMEENWGTFGLTLHDQTSAHRKQRLVYTNSNHCNKDLKYKNMHLIQESLISAGWVCGTEWDGSRGTCPITQCPAQGGLLASDLARAKERTCRMVGPGELEKAADVGAWKTSLASNKERGLLITFNSAFSKK